MEKQKATGVISVFESISVSISTSLTEMTGTVSMCISGSSCFGFARLSVLNHFHYTLQKQK